MEFSGDNTLFSFGLDKKVQKWDINSGTAVDVAQSMVKFLDIAISPDGSTLAASDRTGITYIINLDNPDQQKTSHRFSGPIEMKLQGSNHRAWIYLS